jgi:hypothetical protein
LPGKRKRPQPEVIATESPDRACRVKLTADDFSETQLEASRDSVRIKAGFKQDLKKNIYFPSPVINLKRMAHNQLSQVSLREKAYLSQDKGFSDDLAHRF